MVITESPIIRSLIDHLFGGFVNFCKINVSSSNDSLDHSSVYETSPRHLNLSSFPYPAKSKTRPQGDASHTLRSRCAKCVEFFITFLILNIFGTPLNHESLSIWMSAFI
jgi:hypothetical protein